MDRSSSGFPSESRTAHAATQDFQHSTRPLVINGLYRACHAIADKAALAIVLSCQNDDRLNRNSWLVENGPR